MISSGREWAVSGGGVGREGGRKSVGAESRVESRGDALERGGLREKVMRRSRSSGESTDVNSDQHRAPFRHPNVPHLH